MRKILILLFLLLPFTIWAVPPHPDALQNYREEKKFLEFSERIMRDRALGKNNSYGTIPLTGNHKVPVLIIDFPDLPLEQSNPEIFYSDLLNGQTSDDLSFTKYYTDMSNGVLNIQLDVFYVGTSEYGYLHYGEGNDDNVRDLVEEAVVLGDNNIDFSEYDNDNDGYVDTVFVIHAGVGEEVDTIQNVDRIWSHRWQINPYQTGDTNAFGVDVSVFGYTIQPEFVYESGDSTIGVFVHEFGHVLGLPDLYDVGFYDEENPDTLPLYSDGIGDWGIMSGGSWGGGDGSVPAPMTAWSRYQLDWLEIEEINQENVHLFSGFNSSPILSILILIISLLSFILLRKRSDLKLFIPLLIISFNLVSCGHRGTELPLVLADLDISNKAYSIPIDTDEYIILENKYKKPGTWSNSLPGSGLLLTHIDDNIVNDRYWTNNVNNFSLTERLGVKVIEADGDNKLINGYDEDFGSRTDPFYEGNITELINYKSNQENDSTFELINVNSIGSTINFQIFLFDQD